MAVNDWLKKLQSPKFYEGFKGFILYFHNSARNNIQVGNIPCSDNILQIFPDF